MAGIRNDVTFDSGYPPYQTMYYNLRDPAPIFTGYTLGSFPNF